MCPSFPCIGGNDLENVTLTSLHRCFISPQVSGNEHFFLLFAALYILYIPFLFPPYFLFLSFFYIFLFYFIYLWCCPPVLTGWAYGEAASQQPGTVGPDHGPEHRAHREGRTPFARLFILYHFQISSFNCFSRVFSLCYHSCLNLTQLLFVCLIVKYPHIWFMDFSIFFAAPYSASRLFGSHPTTNFTMGYDIVDKMCLSRIRVSMDRSTSTACDLFNTGTKILFGFAPKARKYNLRRQLIKSNSYNWFGPTFYFKSVMK